VATSANGTILGRNNVSVEFMVTYTVGTYSGDTLWQLPLIPVVRQCGASDRSRDIRGEGHT